MQGKELDSEQQNRPDMCSFQGLSVPDKSKVAESSSTEDEESDGEYVAIVETDADRRKMMEELMEDAELVTLKNQNKSPVRSTGFWHGPPPSNQTQSIDISENIDTTDEDILKQFGLSPVDIEVEPPRHNDIQGPSNDRKSNSQEQANKFGIYSSDDEGGLNKRKAEPPVSDRTGPSNASNNGSAWACRICTL